MDLTLVLAPICALVHWLSFSPCLCTCLCKRMLLVTKGTRQREEMYSTNSSWLLGKKQLSLTGDKLAEKHSTVLLFYIYIVHSIALFYLLWELLSRNCEKKIYLKLKYMVLRIRRTNLFISCGRLKVAINFWRSSLETWALCPLFSKSHSLCDCFDQQNIVKVIFASFWTQTLRNWQFGVSVS